MPTATFTVAINRDQRVLFICCVIPFPEVYVVSYRACVPWRKWLVLHVFRYYWRRCRYQQQLKQPFRNNLLSPDDALKRHFTSLKTDLIFLQPRVLEREFQ